jgi:hypothetical protein
MPVTQNAKPSSALVHVPLNPTRYAQDCGWNDRVADRAAANCSALAAVVDGRAPSELVLQRLEGIWGRRHLPGCLLTCKLIFDHFQLASVGAIRARRRLLIGSRRHVQGRRQRSQQDIICWAVFWKSSGLFDLPAVSAEEFIFAVLKRCSWRRRRQRQRREAQQREIRKSLQVRQMTK